MRFGITGYTVVRPKVGVTIVQKITDESLENCERDGRIHEKYYEQTDRQVFVLYNRPRRTGVPVPHIGDKEGASDHKK